MWFPVDGIPTSLVGFVSKYSIPLGTDVIFFSFVLGQQIVGGKLLPDFCCSSCSLELLNSCISSNGCIRKVLVESYKLIIWLLPSSFRHSWWSGAVLWSYENMILTVNVSLF